MVQQYTVEAALTLPRTRTQNTSLSLNAYRNWHFHVSNQLKKAYKTAIASQIDALPQFNTISVEYVICPKTKREFDLMNFACVQSKFFLDALVEAGKLPDDNYHHVISEHVFFGNVCPTNPRMIMIIKDLSYGVCTHPDTRRTGKSSKISH